MHNLRGYDSHLIIKKAIEINEQIGNRKIDGIPNSNEKFMSFSIGNLKFIESMRIMLSSLESLVNNMYDKQYKYKHFTHMQKFYPKHIELLCHTNTYPYKFVYHISKLDHVGLPPKEAFYASLYQKMYQIRTMNMHCWCSKPCYACC